MYCKVTYPILSYAAVQQQCQRLDQFILNLQTLPGATHLTPLATVLDSAQGDASWFASPRNAQLMLSKPPQPNCELPRRELELSEAGSPLLYRVVGCNRARRCCCTCTKLCAHRCLHDCFVRLWLWKRELDSLGIATSPAQLSQPAQAAQLGERGRCRRQARTSQPNARC